MKPALLASLFLIGCQSIVGIEDRYYPVATSALCESYCDTVLSKCTGANAVYNGRQTCLGVCNLLPVGDPLEPSSNTVACRKQQAEQASSEPSFFCKRAGPGGGGTCGSNCAAYCSLVKAACPQVQPTVTNCETQCAALKDLNRFDVMADHEGDTIQCRLVHVSSATVNPGEHCPHTTIRPPADWCHKDPLAPTDCDEFCRIQKAVCPGELATYESDAQCLAVCKNLPLGTNGDSTQNTSGCRQYHCYNALGDAAGHCPHTGPGGDGHCGVDAPDDTGNCHAYCGLLEKACAADFAAQFGTQASCQKNCSNQPAAFGAAFESGYNIAKGQTGNTLACRLLHVSRALTDPTECPSALGDGVCK